MTAPDLLLSAPGGVEAGPRLLAGLAGGARLDLAGHLAVHGSLPTFRARRRSEPPLIGMLEAAGVRGRGGAGFPAASKMRAVLAGGRKPVVVVNASEGEPMSQKDTVLLLRSPHLIIDGAVLAAEALDAKEVVVYLHRGRPGVERSVTTAVAERRDPVRVTVVAGPARYVAGESSAVANFLSGGPAVPVTTPPRISERGVSGRPTYLSNAETFAHIALVGRHGPDWYRSVGTASEPGTLLLTVSGAVQRPGVIEVPFGTTIGEALSMAGGPTGPSNGLLMGGYAGTWLRPEAVQDVPLMTLRLKEIGAGLGVGLLALLPDTSCVITESARIVRWLADESAQQCGPCLNGLPAIAGAIESLAAGRADDLVIGRIERWLRMVNGRGSCHHPGGLVMTVNSLFKAYRDHVDHHLIHGPCANVGTSTALPVPEAPYGPDVEFQ